MKTKTAAKKPAVKPPPPKKRAAAPKGGDGGGPSSGAAWYEEDGAEKEWKRGGIKWTTLEHGGVLFPQLYTPHGKTFKYDGKPVPLTPEQEEVATMFAAMVHTDYATKPVFRANFMKSWVPLLKKTEAGKQVKSIDKCDFSLIKEHLDQLAQEKKEMSKEEKLRIKTEKDAAEAHLIFATVDGRKEKVGNFRVEPPGLFRGRGEHPKMGMLKARIVPEDITINCSEDATVPAVPDLGDGKKHKWGGVVCTNTVTWLAKWTDSINGEDKCVWLAANSSWKGLSDKSKYEKARELKNHIGKVREDYMKGMKSSDVAQQQHSTAVYLIDRLALRVGGEKNTDEEADTVGCCSLRVEHVLFDGGDNMLHLNFLGKDSIEYDNTTEVIPLAFKCIKSFMKKKKPGDELFDQVVPAKLNDYFKSVMDGLSAKVFRTYNASSTLDAELQKTAAMVTAAQRAKEGDINALCNYYTLANKRVAELCNHQKATSPAHAAAIAKFDEKIEACELEIKAAKKANNDSKVESLKKKLTKLQADRKNKDETKNVSLGTSKINYNDPRITIAWCKANEVPIHKQFPKTLMAKFKWAMSVEPEYRF